MLLPATALALALRLTLCGVPGINFSVAGCAVTPAGSPVIATDTAPANELVKTAFTVSLCPAPPAPTVSPLGAAVSEKSPAAAATTVSDTVVEWLSVPDVPVSVTVPLPATAFAPAFRVTLCAVPGVSVSVAGCTVTPEGPVSATDTVPVKPFVGAALTLSCCPAPPAISVRLEGIVDKEKSANGVKPAPLPVASCDPLPHDTNVRKSTELPHQAKAFEEKPM